MRSFVRVTPQGREFWNILPHLSRYGYTTSLGTGGRGLLQMAYFADDTTARQETENAIAEKLTAGFVETTSIPWHGGFVSPLRETLEQTLWDNPDDLATHMAYADHLSELGDPRGEFIQVQLALEDATRSPTEREQLRLREAELLAQHERAWLGPLAGFWIDRIDQFDWMDGSGEPNQLTWKRGWVNALSLDGASPHLVAAVRQRQPLLRCLRELRVLHGRYDDDRPGFIALGEINIYRNVRLFLVGNEQSDQCYMDRDTVYPVAFFSQMPHLEELHLYSGETPFDREFPHLRKLTAHHGWGEYPLEILAANTSLKNLTHLACWPRGQGNEEPLERNSDGSWAYITRTGATALFNSPNLPRLQHLMLRNSDIGDAGIRALIDSGILARLRTLDLLGGCVTDEGAQLLAQRPETRRLEMLNLNENMLTEVGISALQAAGVSFSAETQFDLDALETREYLYSGDCE